MIETTTTVTFVTPRCFGGRHDDSGMVTDEREGLVVIGREREDREGEGREREEKEKKRAMRWARVQCLPHRQQ